MEIYEVKIIEIQKIMPFEKLATIKIRNPKTGKNIVSPQIAVFSIKNLNLKEGSIVFVYQSKNYSWKIHYDKLCEFYGVQRIETENYKKLK